MKRPLQMITCFVALLGLVQSSAALRKRETWSIATKVAPDALAGGWFINLGIMRALIVFFLTACVLFAAPVKVAVMGDSITFGSGAEMRENNRYASRLGHLLGESYEVRAFAASSLCMLRKADLPFAKTKHMKEALAFRPDIAVIVLGTNDTCQNDRRKNWEHHGELKEDALFLIGKLRKANPRVVVHLCSPLPMFPNQSGIKPERKGDLTERSKRLPAIRKAYAAAAKMDGKVHFHDLTRALRANETTDGVHPHTFGHERIAYHLYDLLSHDTGKMPELAVEANAPQGWHGFARYDFKLPESKAACILVVPHTVANGKPWIWRARFFGHQPALDLALLDRGYHLAYCDVANLYGNAEAMARCEEFHALLTTRGGLSSKPIFEGMSRGGLMIFNFAVKHPDKVTAIYGDNPVCNFNSWPGGKNGKLSPPDWERCLKSYGISVEQAEAHPQITDQAVAAKLAKSEIPVALVLGMADEVVPPTENGGVFGRHYAEAGGPIKVWRKPGLGHHPHGLDPIDPLLRFLLRAGDKSALHAATLPTPSSEYRSGAGWGGNWWQAFDHLKAEVKKHPETKFVFLGDSITQGLTGHGNRKANSKGKRPIDRYYGAQNTLSLGLSGDRTELILWRLQHGQLDGIKPTHLVLMIGVNNINRGHTGEETADGSRAIVEWFRANRPEIKLLLLGSFPTGKGVTHPARAEVRTLHRLIAPLADGKTIFYQDLNSLFLNPEGTLNDCMRGDAIHINGKGQETWMKAVQPFFAK